ncbi:MAG TPA: VWA domain-containing protein [Bryobacteraceae bacterium]|nr:VWA domain-containing protein [Bryobacteraceae bacterium]
MQPWKAYTMCASALLAAAGLLIGQEQGPIRDPGSTVAKPRKPDAEKKDGDSDLPKIPSEYTKKDKIDVGNLPTFKGEVNIVTVDVAVIDGKGHFIPGIPKGNFRVLEDNVPQPIKGVNMGEAPLTVSMVIEFSNLFQSYWGPAWYQTLQLAWGFASTLKPEDYVAVVAYDIKPEILSDFTTDRSKTQEALSRLQIAAWREANLFDAITDTADRMSGIEGRKAILLISSGIDTFSKMTFDQCRKKLQEAGVPIYGIGLMQTLRELMDARGGMGPIQRMDFLQADNEMKTFAKETGGQAYFPRFMGEYPGIFQEIHQALRNQYVITYSPQNTKRDGTFRKIKVELVNPATNEPLPVKDEKGKPIKYQIVAKAGYKAPREVE